MAIAEYWEEFEGARTYATLMPYLSHYTELQQRVLTLLEPYSHIGDFACGPGLFSQLILSSGKSVVALDNSRGMLEFFKQSLSSNAAKNISLIDASIEDIPLENEEVEASICINALYNNNDPQTIVDELVRVTKELIIITGPKPGYDHELLVKHSDEDFIKNDAYSSHSTLIETFFQGNKNLQQHSMPTLLFGEDVAALLKTAGCREIVTCEDVFYGQGFLVAAKK